MNQLLPEGSCPCSCTSPGTCKKHLSRTRVLRNQSTGGTGIGAVAGKAQSPPESIYPLGTKALLCCQKGSKHSHPCGRGKRPLQQGEGNRKTSSPGVGWGGDMNTRWTIKGWERENYREFFTPKTQTRCLLQTEVKSDPQRISSPPAAPQAASKC